MKLLIETLGRIVIILGMTYVFTTEADNIYWFYLYECILMLWVAFPIYKSLYSNGKDSANEQKKGSE